MRKGLLFDLDAMHTIAWREYLNQHGFTSEGMEERMHGKRNDEIVRGIAQFLAA